MKLIVRWMLLAAALLLVAYLYPGVSVASFGAAMGAALGAGTAQHHGAAAARAADAAGHAAHARAVPVRHQRADVLVGGRRAQNGFNVTGFGAALIGSLIYSLCGMVIDVAVERLFARD
jgi:putative membrane protein